ncbi:MAG TPA: hypothetical protein VES79_03655, partial [Solirubrobacteraceae bacterium]|nr:hypothetical protein [Solirubrobacteraceae bacterium]
DLHGDKGVWRLLDQRAGDVAGVPVAGPIPLDVDTPEDYAAVLANNVVRCSPDHRSGSAPTPV